MITLRRCATITLVLVLLAGYTAASGAAERSKTTTKTVTDRDKGTTVFLHVGDRLKVVLASTYWTIGPASKSSVLRAAGRPVTTPKSQGCVPGGGCGTKSARFTALKKGRATVNASRVTCGEALRCTGDDGKFEVSVVVR